MESALHLSDCIRSFSLLIIYLNHYDLPVYLKLASVIWLPYSSPPPFIYLNMNNISIFSLSIFIVSVLPYINIL